MAKRKRDETNLPESIETAHVLFMDVVGYSKLLNDVQAGLIGQLTELVESTSEFQRALKQKEVEPLPTGDGMALVFKRFPEAPARCALEIAAALQGLPEIKLRMGIHSGPVYFRRDIRGNLNAFGDGVNFAARAMDRGGAGQILLTKEAADSLLRLTAWNGALSDLGEYEVKHGVRIHLYNLHKNGLGSLEQPPRSAEDPSRYLEVLREETGWMNIQGLQVGTGKAHRFPIRDLYVPLTISPEGVAEDEELKLNERPRKVPLEEALQTHPRLVLIGDPGSGKSTFLRWIAFTELTRPDPKDAAFTILIGVADLAFHIRTYLSRPNSDGPTSSESPAWIQHFLGVRSAERKWRLSATYFDRELEKGCLLMVDGLDEAANATERGAMAKLLDNATQAYPRSRFVVTTRPQSYTGMAVLNGFERRQIADLDTESMEVFLRHWSKALHSGDTQASGAHFRELRTALLSRPEIRRMARNPVMLTALAVVHWNEKRLPEQRADLYASIIRWLSVQREKRPGRPSAAETVRRLAQLALAMQDHPKGRQVQIPKREAAEALSFLPIEQAERFLDEEEVDSGIVVSRGREVRFWHLTFQEFLAARILSGDDERRAQLIRSGKAFSPEQWETMLLLAGVLSDEGFGIPKVDALVGALLTALSPSLKEQARCVGLLGAIERDLRPYKYQVTDPRYAKALDEAYRIFTPEGASVDFNDRLDAAEALGQAGDRRLTQDNWVTIPAGPFRMGTDKKDDPEAYDDESPVHEVYLDSYQIGRYPVTVEEYSRVEGLEEPENWEEQKAHRNRPVVGVSWDQAAAYCKAVGGRLPTEAEWERAARGVSGRKYPWGGDAPDAARANYEEGGPGRPTPVGLYPSGATPDENERIDDLAGNVLEWVADWWDERYYDRSPRENPKGPAEGGSRVVRGGSFVDLPSYLRGAYRNGIEPVLRYVLLGFRCVREV
jgi:formylglycine-generating enzyme required for sulfatase activity/class 3 adenylate cyclase